MCNFTGCLEITEINNIGPFTFRKALDRHNIKSCRFSLSEGTSAAIKGTFSGESEAFKAASSSPTHPGLLSACPENLCQNGGTCQQINLPGSVASFQCDCPLHFTGRFCEKEYDKYIKILAIKDLRLSDYITSSTINSEIGAGSF
uniref:Protein eyes shut homolog n=1 Tax=Pogona vitticeps TaxID=103695 RepID=A0ABM5EPL6_9SAUR